MDEAFRPLSATLAGFVDQPAVVGGDPWGQRVVMTGIEIESPVELEVSRGRDGRLRIGTTPPLYPLMTTVGPVFHRLTVRASRAERPDDDAKDADDGR